MFRSLTLVIMTILFGNSVPAFSQLDVKMYTCTAQYTARKSCFKKNLVFPDSSCGGGSILENEYLSIYWAAGLAEAEEKGCQVIRARAISQHNKSWSEKCIEPQPFGRAPTISPGYCREIADFSPNRNHYCRCRENTSARAYMATFQTKSRGTYLEAVSGGGSSIRANRVDHGINTEIKIYGGHELKHGDRVRLQSNSGHWIVNKNGRLMAISGYPEDDGLFDIYKLNSEDSKTIESGDTVFLKAYINKTVVVPNGSYSEVYADNSIVGRREFIITFLGKEQFGKPIEMNLTIADGPNLQQLSDATTVATGDNYPITPGNLVQLSWDSEQASSCRLGYQNTYTPQTWHEGQRGKLSFEVEESEFYVIKLVCRRPKDHLVESLRIGITGVRQWPREQQDIPE